jgi:hypothetical protein
MKGGAGSAAGRESPAGLTPQATVREPAVDEPAVKPATQTEGDTTMSTAPEPQVWPTLLHTTG